MKVEDFELKLPDTSAQLKAYLLDDSDEMLQGNNRPGVIINPGGGYFSCSDKEAEPVALYFARQGYHAFVLRYSTYNDGELSMPDLSKKLPSKPSTEFPRQVRELGKAMIFVKDHAKEWHLDQDRVAVCGFSAGAHNAALYSSRYQDDMIADYLNADSEYLRPAACILGYAITDYVLMKNVMKEKTNPMDVAFMAASNVAFFGEEEPSQSKLEDASPVDHVSDKIPPTFIWTTATDPLVNPINSIELAQKLASVNVPYELHIFGTGGHGMSLADQSSAGAKSDISDDVSQWAGLCEKWLTKLFYLPLPELSAFEQMKKNNEIAQRQ